MHKVLIYFDELSTLLRNRVAVRVSLKATERRDNVR